MGKCVEISTLDQAIFLRSWNLVIFVTLKDKASCYKVITIDIGIYVIRILSDFNINYYLKNHFH